MKSTTSSRPLGRSPHGERGLKLCCCLLCTCRKPSLPSRGAWIEICGNPRHTRDHRSLPSRGAWIEIGFWLELSCSRVRRSPHGERGLKSSTLRPAPNCLLSLPSRGAWIEMNKKKLSLRILQSLPSRGAWIEIFEVRLDGKPTSGRSPHGERGLKCAGARA